MTAGVEQNAASRCARRDGQLDDGDEQPAAGLGVIRKHLAQPRPPRHGSGGADQAPPREERRDPRRRPAKGDEAERNDGHRQRHRNQKAVETALQQQADQVRPEDAGDAGQQQNGQLSKRDRSLITVATLIAGYRINELPFHLKFALQNGVTREELVETITHLAFYAG